MEVSDTQKQALYRLGEWLITYRKIVASLAVLTTLTMAFPATKLEMHTSFEDLLPYKHPFIAVHSKYAAKFGGANSVMIMIEVKEGSLFTPEALGKVYAATAAVDRLPGVNHDQIDSIGHRTARWIRRDETGLSAPPIMWRPPKNQRDADEVRDIVHQSEHIYGSMVSLDDKAALIRANFREGRFNYHDLFVSLDEKIIKPFEDGNTTVWVAGEPRLYGWIYEYVGEVKWIFAVCTVFMWVMLYLYFHDWRGALRPTITAVISAIWGLGMVHLIGFPMDPLALVIPFFATARALSHSVQMHDRYYEEYKKNDWDKHRAIVAAFAELFVPTLSGITTDALGMLVILLVPVAILQRIAVWASIWVSTVAISELILNPIIYHYLRAPDRENVLKREQGIFQRLLVRWATLAVGPRACWVIVAVWLGVFAIAATQWRHLTIGDPTAATPLLNVDSPYNQAHTQIQQFFGGVEPLIIVAEGKDKAALHEPAAQEAMEALQDHLEADPEVGYSFSLTNIIKATQMLFYDAAPWWAVIPDRKAEIANLFFYYFLGTTPSESSKFVDPSWTVSPVTFFCANHQGDTVARIIEKARAFIAANPNEVLDFRLAGGLIGVTAAANEEILRNDVLMNVLGFFTMWIIIVFQYRSFVAGFLMLVPLFLANGIANAYMGFREIGINLQSLPVVTVGVGFGIDYGVYITSRAIEEIPHVGGIAAGVKRAIETSGKAVTFTAGSFSVATLAWAASDIRFNAEMGLMLFMWMVISFIAAVSLLPAILVVAKPKFLTS